MTGLYDPRYERDACGIGLVANAGGTASRQIIDDALDGLAGVMHRGAVAADGRSGDGAGVLIPLPTRFLASAAAAWFTLFKCSDSARKPFHLFLAVLSVCCAASDATLTMRPPPRSHMPGKTA